MPFKFKKFSAQKLTLIAFIYLPVSGTERSFLCKQKRKVPFKFKKIVYYQYPVRIGNSAFFYQVNLNFILIQIVLQTVFVAVFHRRNIEEKFEPFAEMIAVPVAQR